MDPLQHQYHMGTMPNVLCCMCGVSIPSNPASMCVDCIRSQVDITDGISKQVSLNWCKKCNRYLQPPKIWVPCELESKELLTVCLKKIKGLNRVKLIDAGFIWTEPHSRRIKMKLSIQKEIFSGAILQQSFIVEFIVEVMICEACQRVAANDSWAAVVQLRQRVDHKRTFLYLEQLIIAHDAHKHTINIKSVPAGIDFFFANDGDAEKMLRFLKNVAPIYFVTPSEQLVSADLNNNTARYKMAYPIELAAVCKDDFVCLPPSLTKQRSMLGSPFALCSRVTDALHLVNPNSGVSCMLQTDDYFRTSSTRFDPLCSTSHLLEFTVLDVEDTRERVGKFRMVDVQVARTRDLGVNDQIYYVRSHLGNIINPGDTVLGYDLTTLVFNEMGLANVKQALPEIVLVKKSYPANRKKSRYWKLQRLEMETDMGNMNAKKAEALREQEEQHFEDFQNDLEADKDYRQHIKIYRDRNVPLPTERDTDGMSEGGDDMAIGLDELLDELTIDDRMGDDGDDDGDYDDDDDEDLE
eukprot:TRINITY_DN1323_c0_g1::TRINITY_DN1323_c0_g1_i1::g.20034::m.20034 TRINITY_DN1323_c0_g1::TRINITY_DN1323_c0_g1_i1::g.20034  ORF type:complete len:546 (-),score=158.05,sp/Q55BF2/NMD3_DICDI/47.77/2e-161,NMD3/PF04981.8/1.6e-68 TRINITY_DN1323_c0_g1_i1:55-1626(-)